MIRRAFIYSKKDLSDISDLISDYSNIYQRFENLQEPGTLTGGDQKTGVIGEYYAARYIQNRYGVETKYAPHGAGHDIEYTYKKKKYQVQVKAVSFHSATRTISPISKGDWGELYLILLDQKFKPVGFWINKREQVKFNDKGKIPSAKIPKDVERPSTSCRLDFRNNQIKAFLHYVFSDTK